MFKAVKDSVLLELVNLEETTNEGIILKSNNVHPIYKVISIGDKNTSISKNSESPIKIGDYVMIPRTVGNDIIYEGKTYHYCKTWEILCIVEM